jgi:hypothetical protein
MLSSAVATRPSKPSLTREGSAQEAMRGVFENDVPERLPWHIAGLLIVGLSGAAWTLIGAVVWLVVR